MTTPPLEQVGGDLAVPGMTVSDGDTLVGINGCPVILPPYATMLETQWPTTGVHSRPVALLMPHDNRRGGIGIGMRI